MPETMLHIAGSAKAVSVLNPDGTVPASPLLKRTQITVTAGSLVPVIQDNV